MTNIKTNMTKIPPLSSNKLYLDYLSGAGTASKYFTHGSLDFTNAFESRRQHTYPRRELARTLAEYNASIGAHPSAIENAHALADPATFCAITGQQAGFLGGPAYACYKIITTIRLAQHLQKTLGKRVIPIFWLASEDHDFGEINRAHFPKPDGEVGEVKFAWEQAGRPIADLPITENVQRAYAAYFENIPPGPAKEIFAPQPGEDYSPWQARVWAQLFANSGLVIVEPHILRPLASNFFESVLGDGGEIVRRLGVVAGRLADAGYTPALDADRVGRLYTFREDGRRVRVGDTPPQDAGDASLERYSTGVALRPLLADSLLPSVASVLGPGELAYHAMLKPLYELFNLPQPVYYPRKSYTVVAESEAERMAEYHTSAEAILTGGLDPDAVFRRLMPEAEAEDGFSAARQKVEEAFAPLRAYVEEIDPNLGKGWKYGLSNALRGLDNLEGGAVKARMSQLGFSRGELRRLSNSLLPRDRPQERVFPLPYFLNRYGMEFIDAIFSTGEIDDFSHHIITLEDQEPRCSEQRGS